MRSELLGLLGVNGSRIVDVLVGYLGCGQNQSEEEDNRNSGNQELWPLALRPGAVREQSDQLQLYLNIACAGVLKPSPVLLPPPVALAW